MVVKKKILMMSDSPFSSTGFATVSKNLARIFTHLGYEVHISGYGWGGYPIETDTFTIYQAGLPRDRQFGYWTFEHYLKSIKPDAVVTVTDLQYIDYVVDQIGETPWIAYFPVDSGDWSDDYFDIARAVDYAIPYSKFGKKLLESEGVGIYDMIYHGVDQRMYYYMGKKNIRSHFNDFNDDTFVIGTVASLNRRKMWNVWFEVVSRFLRGKEDAFAVALVDPNRPIIGGYQFNQSRVGRDMLHKILTPPDYNHMAAGFSPNKVNVYYNLFDCHLLTTGGEGFGLPILESMSAKCTNLATDYTTCPEIIGNTGYNLPVKHWATVNGTKRPVVDIEKAVEYLEELYNDRGLCEELGEKALARSRTFTWERTIPQWEKVLGEACG
jgi:glycosyltransferase involved in cell wall biosynthesis